MSQTESVIATGHRLNYQRKTLTDFNNSLVESNPAKAVLYLGLRGFGLPHLIVEVSSKFPGAQEIKPIGAGGRQTQKEERDKLRRIMDKPFIEQELWKVVDLAAYDEYEEEGVLLRHEAERKEAIWSKIAPFNQQKRLDGEPELDFMPAVSVSDEPQLWGYKGWAKYLLNATQNVSETEEILDRIVKDYNRERGYSSVWRKPVFRQIGEFWDFHKQQLKEDAQKLKEDAERWEHIKGIRPIPEQAQRVKELGGGGGLVGVVPELSPASIITNTPSFLKRELRFKLRKFGLLGYLDRDLPAFAMRRYPYEDNTSNFCKLVGNYVFGRLMPTDVTEDDLGIVSDLVFLRGVFKDQLGLDDRIRIHIPYTVPPENQIGNGWSDSDGDKRFIFHPSGPGGIKS